MFSRPGWIGPGVQSSQTYPDLSDNCQIKKMRILVNKIDTDANTLFQRLLHALKILLKEKKYFRFTHGLKKPANRF